MSKLRITKIFEFEMAHALWGYEGPCKNIHGHSYKLSVTVSGIIKEKSSLPNESMVMDFAELKKIAQEQIISKYDHALVLDESIPVELKNAARVMSEKIIYIKGMPTCETLTHIFAECLKKFLPSNVKLHHLKLQETASSYAEWFSGDNEKSLKPV